MYICIVQDKLQHSFLLFYHSGFKNIECFTHSYVYNTFFTVHPLFNDTTLSFLLDCLRYLSLHKLCGVALHPPLHLTYKTFSHFMFRGHFLESPGNTLGPERYF